jgi:hypothetical protein
MILGSTETDSDEVDSQPALLNQVRAILERARPQIEFELALLCTVGYPPSWMEPPPQE